jgi:hypothetical protein
MTDPLVGGLASFSGNRSDPVIVSNEILSANSLASDPLVSVFLNNSGSGGCVGYPSTKGQVLDAAQAAYLFLQSNPVVVPSCFWLQYFGPFSFVSNFNVRPPTDPPITGWWRLRASFLTSTSFELGVPPNPGCFNYSEAVETFVFHGQKPRIGNIEIPSHWCLLTDTNQFTDQYGLQILTPKGNGEFRSGTASIVLLTDDTEYSDPTMSQKTDGLFMPIPEIPAGFPDPPAPPPLVLTGAAILTALDDSDCSEIVQRGGGFQNITDIANQYETNSDALKIDYAVRTDSPNHFNIDELESELRSLDLNFWVTVNLPTTSGGAPITLTAMINAYNADIDATKITWLTKNALDAINFQIVQAFDMGEDNLAFRTKFIDAINKFMSDPTIFHPVVEIDATIPGSGITFSIDTDGAIKMTIKLGGDAVGTPAQIVAMTKRYCDGDKPMTTTVLAVPNGLGGYETDAEWKQMVLDILYQLRECCNPCLEVTPSPQILQTFYGDQTSSPGDPVSISNDTPDLERVTFNILENHFPKAFYFGTQPLYLLAKFAWRDKLGRYGKIRWINTDNFTIVAPSEDIVGFMCHCYTGVALSSSIRTKATPSFPGAYSP